MATNSQKEPHFLRLLGKVIIIFILINFGFAFLPKESISKLSIYNVVIPGRERFPFGENPTVSFNMTISDIDAMFASHKISGIDKDVSEFRIFLVGDSSIWGYLQKPNETLAGLIQNNAAFKCADREIKIYNLGYPSLSVLKDLAFIEKSAKYEPDMIIWFVTLESLVKNDQMETPLIKNNSQLANHLIEKYQLGFEKREINLFQRTFTENRRYLADLLRLQLYGFLWAGSGIDQEYPENYPKALRDFEADESFKDFLDKNLELDDLSVDVLTKPQEQYQNIDFLVINEPILISQGKNSQIRYNFYYPRWAFDQYREILRNFLETQAINYYDFWDLIPEKEFTNSAIHLSPEGENLLANQTLNILKSYCQNLEK